MRTTPPGMLPSSTAFSMRVSMALKSARELEVLATDCADADAMSRQPIRSAAVQRIGERCRAAVMMLRWWMYCRLSLFALESRSYLWLNISSRHELTGAVSHYKGRDAAQDYVPGEGYS